jgi:hypothetical protein
LIKMEWIDINDKMPPHMKEIKVWIEHPTFKGYERERPCVFLAFDGNIYDAEEQQTVNYVTKWRLL